ncbi:hypothetical protein, partial [Anaerotruncus colihominis]|uniref:hypothetical protein n=1 Tax=Anaerotruncus colihominis TaxID=169435 RepID=UPI00210E5933
KAILSCDKIRRVSIPFIRNRNIIRRYRAIRVDHIFTVGIRLVADRTKQLTIRLIRIKHRITIRIEYQFSSTST